MIFCSYMIFIVLSKEYVSMNIYMHTLWCYVHVKILLFEVPGHARRPPCIISAREVNCYLWAQPIKIKGMRTTHYLKKYVGLHLPIIIIVLNDKLVFHKSLRMKDLINASYRSFLLFNSFKLQYRRILLFIIFNFDSL